MHKACAHQISLASCLGSAEIAAPSFLYSGVRCLQCPHLHTRRALEVSTYVTALWTMLQATSSMQAIHCAFSRAVGTSSC